MGDERYHTPKSVWITSAIAATTLHLGILGWVTAVWHRSQGAPDPAPIAVIALPAAELSPATTALPSPEAAPPVTAEAAPSRVSAPDPAPAPTPAPDGSSESSPTPEPTSPKRSPRAPIPPASPTPTESVPAEPPARGAADSDLPAGWRTTWGLREVPDGSDLPDQLPELPADWQTVTSRPSSACPLPASGLPAAPLRVVLQLTVETDGSVSASRIWETSGDPDYDDWIQCLVSTELPPLQPALAGGAPIPTDMVLLTVVLSQHQR